jgi:hypothetical protein
MSISDRIDIKKALLLAAIPLVALAMAAAFAPNNGAAPAAAPAVTPSATPSATTPDPTEPTEPTETPTPEVTKDALYSSAEDLYEAAVAAGHEGNTWTPDDPSKANSLSSGSDGWGDDEDAYFLVYEDEATMKSDLDAIHAGDTPDSFLAGKNWIIIGSGLDELQTQLGGEHPTWAAKKPKPQPKPKPAAHKVTERQWAKVVKNPDRYEGKRYIIYGEVNQFDSATGESNFLADTANRNTTSYGYFDGENSWMEGKASKLEDLIEGDVFKASVTVVGSYSYDTQMGGNTTVPELHVNSIKQVGHN